MIETIHGNFKLVKNFRDAFVLDDFNKKYIDIFNIYPYIVGDYSAGILRMKGFTKDTYHFIPDYIVESCAPNCAYFILENPKFNPNIDRKE
ncbi:MAG: DUF1027 domain-containing protein [Bacilli bacterium]|nr:DUF1027 domain-containing protein [Bacilli bacterium]